MKESVMNSRYSKIHIPEELSNRVDSAVKHGIRKEKRKKFISSIGIAVAVLILFISTINISPAFAGYMGSIPGFSSIVRVFKFDKGIKTAVDNDFIQTVEKSAEDNGIKLTIKNIVFDKRRFILFYTIEVNEKNKDIRTQYGVNLVNENNEKIAICHGVGLYLGDISTLPYKKEGFFEFINSRGFEWPEKLTLVCSEMYKRNLINHGNKEVKITGNWNISFMLDKKFLDAKPEEITLNKEVELGHFKCNIKKVEIYPTAVYATVQVNEPDDLKFVDFKNLRLIDGKGMEYKVINEEISSKNKERIFIFESTYFIDSKELTLAADGIYHIPQEEQYITFDIKNKKLVDNAGYGIEYPRTVMENSLFDKDYNLRIDFNITDREIVENHKIKGALVEGIGFDYAVDGRGNKYDIELSTYDDISQDNIIRRMLCLNTGKNSPQILKFKVKYALKGTDGRINIKIK